jgi:hypothetical protein
VGVVNRQPKTVSKGGTRTATLQLSLATPELRLQLKQNALINKLTISNTAASDGVACKSTR